MQYNVSQLIKEPTGSKRTYEINEDSMEIEDINLSGIQGQILLIKTDIGIWLQGSADLYSKSECVRCLERFHNSFAIKFDAQFYPSRNASSGLLATEDSFAFDPDNMLDITDAFRQSIIASASMKPLCDDNCLGLCHSCGIDMNYHKCSCVDGLIDNYWNDLSPIVNSIGVNSVRV